MSEKVLDSMRVKVGAMDDTYVNNPKSVAGQFSASKAYAAGEYVYYNRKLYCFTAAHAAGAWTGSDASEVTVSGELSAIKADLSEMNTATSEDVGKVLLAKTVADGKVTEWEFGEAGGISMTAVSLLNTILSEAVYGTDQTANIAALNKELSNIAPVSISAVLSDAVTPYVYTPYSDLAFVVTATYDDYSTQQILEYHVDAGEVVSGTNVATIRYRGCSTQVTFQSDNTPVYRISYNLSNVVSSNTSANVIQGERYTTEISLIDNDYYISEYSVTMDGADVTSTVYNNGNIVIASVIGDVVISVTAVEYTYLDALPRRRKGFDSIVYFSPDNHVTSGTRVNNSFVGNISEYPAKYDCTINWTITNITESNVNLGIAGFALASGNDQTFVQNNEYAYKTNITNVGNVLAPGESLSGTYLWRAGYQLVFTSDLNNIGKLDVKLRGEYVPEMFTDYTAVYKWDKSSLTTIAKPYADFYWYSDDGETLLTSGKATYVLKINAMDGIEPGTYDIAYRCVYREDINTDNITSEMFGAISLPLNGATQVNYCVGTAAGVNRNTYLTVVNIWFYGQLYVAENGMSVLVSTNEGLIENGIELGAGYYEVRMKEAA